METEPAANFLVAANYGGVEGVNGAALRPFFEILQLVCLVTAFMAKRRSRSDKPRLERNATGTCRKL